MTKVVLLTDDEELLILQGEPNEDDMVYLAEPAQSSTDLDALMDRVLLLKADIVVVGPDIDQADILEVSTKIRFNRPEIECIAYHHAPTEFMVEALRSGLRDVVDPADGLDQLVESLKVLRQTSAVHRENVLAAHGREDKGRVISVVAPKGGVGKTTVAVNLAYALASRAPNQVVIVDLDLSGGDVAEMMQVESHSNVAVAARSGAFHDPATLKLSLAAHSSGVLVLPAPTSLVDASDADMDELSQLLQTLGELFQYVVVDTGPGAPDAAIPAVRVCDDLIAVATPEVGGLKSLDRYLTALETIGMSWPRSHFVLNRLDRRAGMSREDVEAVLGQPVDVIFAYDRQVMVAANQGMPYLQMRPKGSLAGGYAELVERVAVPSKTKATSKGWFR